MSLRIVRVNSSNRKQAEALRVYPSQKDFIESVEECMQEADAILSWRPVCLYDGEVLVGFAMYGYIEEAAYNRLWFDRLLIDYHYQGKGYGKEAFELVFTTIRKEYPTLNMYLSVYDENEIATKLYLSHGFVYTGEFDTKKERIMMYDASKEGE